MLPKNLLLLLCSPSNMAIPATQLQGLWVSSCPHKPATYLCIGIFCHFRVYTSGVTTCLQSREDTKCLGHFNRCSTRDGLHRNLAQELPSLLRCFSPNHLVAIGRSNAVNSSYGVTGFASLSRGSSSASFPLGSAAQSKDHF